MAQALVPLASSAVEYETSPTSRPPPTAFPYPERPGSVRDESRGASGATLQNVQTQEVASNASIQEDGEQVCKIQRQPFALTKFETETAGPVAPKVPEPVRQHRSTTDNPVLADSAAEESSSDSDISTSSDDESPPQLQRAQTQPAGNALSKSQLNRVRTHQPRSEKLRVRNEFFGSLGRVARDGRLKISVNETAQTGYLAKALGGAIQHQLGPRHDQETRAAEQSRADFRRDKDKLIIPRLNIVIMVVYLDCTPFPTLEELSSRSFTSFSDSHPPSAVQIGSKNMRQIGSRGDIQPFLKIGKILKDKYHHRVRIASHPTFKEFVEEEIGLEFFSVGGDPSELMAFMVKNPGLIPSMETIKSGEIGRRRESMYQMFQGFWRACINATDDETDITNLKLMGSKPPFVADAIIANPPSFAHIHIAELLRIPLHLVFTFPYSPTQAFPHPLANIKSTSVDQTYTNFMSYPLVDLMTWQGLGDLVNRFRVQTLGLEPVSTLWAPGQLSRLKVPMTYLWSPSLVSKPRDWGPEIDIAGYVFLDLATAYKPPQDLAGFLQRSDDRSIIYIGFGSISGIDDPQAFTRMIFDAVAKADVRAVISRGWGGMGDGMDKPDGVFLVDNVPHDWLFPQVDAVVHHGGAGTTAAGLRFGKPTMVVPFFGDQPFWSKMIAKAGAGAKESLPLKKLDSDKFAEGIRQCLEPEARAKAQEIAKSIEEEGDGAENAVDSFHRALDLEGPHSLRCSIFPDRIAVWKSEQAGTRLSALAADLLVENRLLQWSDLDLLKKREWTDFQGPGEPITGAGGVVIQAFREAYHDLAEMHDTTKRDIKRYEKRKRKQKGKSTAEGLVLPGRIAMATRGTSVDKQKKEHSKLVRQVNLQGQAEPVKLVRSTTSSSDRSSPAVMIFKDIVKGVGHSGKSIARAPLQMWNALALGFHNAPRLYGDRTVRPSPQGINGFRTGVRVAGKEFWYGLYDGVTGIVQIPRLEVHDAGMSALPKGIARGFGGLVLKPIAGVLGLGAYTAKGAHQSIRRRTRDTRKTERWIRRARIAQGQRDVQVLQDQKQQGLESQHSTHTTDLQEVRNQALRCWTAVEKDKISEERDTRDSLTLLNKRSIPTQT
ncbi:hypothetical protein H2200_002304 [Cladophialophora chaetospira]|uniref:Glycosyltransferase family 28 N-terminal domain-containing protein n=1 Tax=Cladophialophora chaetospira TaxID=386627 RepID=A0AA39CNE7_9EURO|nr:hypothetical protein H2200_002304 [Cladophialophora chaetospira]